jgi:hypothetical protein
MVQREHIANAPSIPGTIIDSCAVCFAAVISGALIGGGSGGAIGVFVGIPIAIVVYRKCGATINRVWNPKEMKGLCSKVRLRLGLFAFALPCGPKDNAYRTHQ